MTDAPLLSVRGLSVTAGHHTLLRDVNLDVMPQEVCALIGPSGVGKTTLLKCLNRLVDLTPRLRVRGEIRFAGRSLYGAGADPDRLRAEVGMLFQQPVVFPRSIYQNVIFGLRRVGRAPRRSWRVRAEQALREAALWEEVKERLDEPATALSTGQQQRLCLARTLALEPRVVLMDEPTSALDPHAAAAVEQLVRGLAARRTVVLVTHDMSQARRVAHTVACLGLRDGAGELLEHAPTEQLFTRPSCAEVAAYLGAYLDSVAELRR